MKAFISILLLTILSSCVRPPDLGYYWVIPKNGEPSDKVIYRIVEDSDCIITYTRDNTYGIGQRNVSEGHGENVTLSFEDIQNLLGEDEHKEFIVVRFHPLVKWNDKDSTDNPIKHVISQMKQVGYERIVILGSSATGVFYLADTKLHPNIQYTIE